VSSQSHKCEWLARDWLLALGFQLLLQADQLEDCGPRLEGLGGKENVTSVDNCITRLRIEVRDYTAVDEKKIKSAGVAGIIRPSKTSVQVVIGPKVQFVADEVK